jgi:hypothetical protein
MLDAVAMGGVELFMESNVMAKSGKQAKGKGKAKALVTTDELSARVDALFEEAEKFCKGVDFRVRVTHFSTTA